MRISHIAIEFEPKELDTLIYACDQVVDSGVWKGADLAELEHIIRYLTTFRKGLNAE